MMLVIVVEFLTYNNNIVKARRNTVFAVADSVFIGGHPMRGSVYTIDVLNSVLYDRSTRQ